LYKNHLVITLLSTLVNNILVALIVFRVVYHQRRHLQHVLVLEAEHGSPDPNNTGVMAMCIESSALIIISSAVLTTLTFTNKIEEASVFMYSLLPHICVGLPECCDVRSNALDTTQVISTLLIIYHVAIDDVMPLTVQPSEKVMAQIRFDFPLSNPPCKEEKV